MQKSIEVTRTISKNLSVDHSSLLEDYNLHYTLGGIYRLKIDIEDQNRIICFIIYAYDPESLWLDLKKDRDSNRNRILENLGANTTLKIYDSLRSRNDDIINMCVFNYLEELKNWKWAIIFNLLDNAAILQRFASEETEAEKSYQKMNKDGEVKTITSDIDVETLVKAHKGKSDLLDQAISKRRQADALLDELRKEFVSTDQATQSDFGFNFTDTAKKKDILSWRSFIREKNLKKEGSSFI